MLPIGIGDVPYVDDRLPSSCVDLSRLQADTGFKPKISFETGIKEVIEAMKRRLRMKSKVLIIGCGIVGSVIARYFAEERDMDVSLYGNVEII